jgi:hypothetical protein
MPFSDEEILTPDLDNETLTKPDLSDEEID